MPAVSSRPRGALSALNLGRADALLLLTVTIWSLNFSVVKATLASFTPLGFMALRFSVVAVTFWVLTYLREGGLGVDRADLKRLAAAGVVGVFINSIGFAYGLHLASASDVALILGSAPLFGVLYAVVSRNDHLDRRLLLGVVAGFAGISLIVGFGGSGAGVSLAARLGGDLGALVTASTWAFYSHLLRPMTRKYSPLRITAYVMAVGAVALLPLGILQQAGQPLPVWHSSAWLGFLYATFLSVAFTNILWFSAIRRQGATRALVYTYLEPFLGVLFAQVTLGERAQPAQWLGGLVVVGAVLLSRAPRAKAAESLDEATPEPPPA